MTIKANAEQFNIETKIIPSDIELRDRFGYSMAASGNKAIIGSRYDDDGGDRSGSAYIFDMTTGVQIAKLRASDPGPVAFFGEAVAIDGDIAIVGAYGDNDRGLDTGAAYLFDVTTGIQLAKLRASDGVTRDQFGKTVGISDNVAIAGAFLADTDAGGGAGAAYLFDVSNGNQLAKLTASDAAESDGFGYSVAVSGDTAIVGSRSNDHAGNSSGAAYLFDVTTGDQLFKLTASDAAAGDVFGSHVAIDGNLALVGASSKDGVGSNSGAAYLFDVTTGLQLAKFTASDADARDLFGESVAINGNKIIIGARYNDDAGENSGSAYIFDLTTGEEIAKLTASDAKDTHWFGEGVAISGNTALVGAALDDNAGLFSGAAYIYHSEVSTRVLIAHTDFSEPAIGAASFFPGSSDSELGFISVGTTTGGENAGLAVTNTGTTPTSPVFYHRSVNATTTFDTVDLTDWTDVEVTIKLQARDAGHEDGDFLHVYLTNGTDEVDLINMQGISSEVDLLDKFADGDYVVMYADIPDDWQQATLVIESSSNSSKGSERYDFDDIRFTGIVAVPEPSSLLLACLALLGLVVVRRKNKYRLLSK